MNLSPRALLAHSRTEAGRRMIRYSATSGVGVIGTQILIVFFYRIVRLEEVQSNLSSTMLMSIPAFALNKYWVWGKRGRARLRREVIPFWAFTVGGWVLSTASVYFVSGMAEQHSTEQTVLVMAASISGFGVLWILKYIFLDKIMFGPDHHTPYDEDLELEEAALEGAATTTGTPTLDR